jgi:hypothetical protein
MVLRCPRDDVRLVPLVTRNLFTKHAGCTTCGTVWITWGDKITRCLTPRECVLTPFRAFYQYNATRRVVKPGPMGKGLL